MKHPPLTGDKLAAKQQFIKSEYGKTLYEAHSAASRAVASAIKDGSVATDLSALRRVAWEAHQAFQTALNFFLDRTTV
jgi:hypothetical protein